jgi:hypothetical protein
MQPAIQYYAYPNTYHPTTIPHVVPQVARSAQQLKLSERTMPQYMKPMQKQTKIIKATGAAVEMQ